MVDKNQYVDKDVKWLLMISFLIYRRYDELYILQYKKGLFYMFKRF